MTQKTGTERKFSPLFEVNAVWPNDVVLRVRRSDSTFVSRNSGDDMVETTREIRDTLTVSRKVRSEKGVRFLRWQWKLQNNMDLFFNVGHSSRRKTNVQGSGGDKNEMKKEDWSNYSGGPGARYNFTTKIDGGFDVNYGRFKPNMAEDLVEKTFLIRFWANIRFN
jgi:hypothetical protein